MTPWVYPPVCGPGEIDSVVAVCEETGKSCFTTGIDPGFANDLFPMTLMGLSGRVDSVRIQEILDYATYSGDYAPMGFGEGPEHTTLLGTSRHSRLLVGSHDPDDRRCHRGRAR